MVMPRFARLLYLLLASVCFPTDTYTLCNDFIDVGTTLSKSNPYFNDPNFGPPASFSTHGVGADDVPLTREDVAIEL